MRSIEKKYLMGGCLSIEERHLAVITLTSDDLRKRIISAGAILGDDSSPRDLANLAISKLEEVCITSPTEGWNKYKSELLVALIVIAEARLFGSQKLREFVYSSVHVTHFTARANAMVVLGRLGVLGDGRAVDLLQNSLKDSSAPVRKNAEAALANIRFGKRSTYRLEDCGDNQGVKD